MIRFRSALLFPLAFLVLPLAAQEDDAGCKDHSLLTRMPGFYIDSCDTQEFDTEDFISGDESRTTVEGKKTEIKYVAKEGARKTSELQLLRNTLNAVKQAGGAVLWTNERAGRGTARFSAGGRETWLSVRAYDQGESYTLVFVEKEAMAQEVTAAAMLAALNQDGRIALNIQFDFGKATIKPESLPIVEQMAALLSGNPSLNVAVEGHTDSVGAAAANQALSESRANAVVAELVKRGIAAGRMTAAGFGPSRPVADNATEEGRAKNRRVELVKR